MTHKPESAVDPVADLGALSGLAPTLASTYVTLAGDIALVVGADGVVRNAAAGDAGLGASAQGWVGRPWVDTATGETRRKLELLLGEVSQGGRSRRREVNHPSDGGQDIPVAWAAVRLGREGPVLALGRDLRTVSAIQQRFIDTQHELERDYWQRRQAEQRYRLLFQVANDAVLVMAADTLRVLEANHAAARLLGQPLDRLVGSGAGSWLADGARAAFEQLLATARSTGRAGEIRLRLADGGAAVEVSATPFRADHRLLLLVRARPASPTQSQRLLTELVEHSPEAVAVTDGTGQVLAANPAFRALMANPASAVAVEGQAIDALLGERGGQILGVVGEARRSGLAQRTRIDRDAAPALTVSAVLLPEGDQERVGLLIAPADGPLAVSLPPAAELAAALAELTEQVGLRPLPQLMREASALAERHLIDAALRRHDGELDAAASELAVSRHSLELRMQRLGMLPGAGPVPVG